GTSISNFAADIFFIIYFMKNSEVVSVNIKLSKPNKEMLYEIFKIGIPAFFMSILMGFTGLVLILFLALYGNFAIASCGISF
ncbi:MATE family efflux transporter, partial [Staphylococcus aureus]|nr:MATE family efflux transporter [Staphylococcus aureus]